MELTELKQIFKKQIAAAKKSKSTLLYFMVECVTKTHENDARDLNYTVRSIGLRDLADFPDNLVLSDRTGKQELDIPIFTEKATDVDSN
jgi:hypothetical protein